MALQILGAPNARTLRKTRRVKRVSESIIRRVQCAPRAMRATFVVAE
jgi:hypothetical protein